MKIRTVKFTIKGYQNGEYELDVHGIMYDQLKKPEDPDANDSFDEEEKAVDLTLKGWIILNNISVLGTSFTDLGTIESFDRSQFREMAVCQKLDNNFIFKVTLGRIECSRGVFEQLVSLINGEISSDPPLERLDFNF